MVEEIVKVEVEIEMSMVKDIPAVVERATVMKTKNVGGPILLYQAEDLGKIVLAKLDRSEVIYEVILHSVNNFFVKIIYNIYLLRVQNLFL